MTELEDLYQELILDHAKKPHNFKRIQDASGTIEAFNPLCGDRYTVYLKLMDGAVQDIGFEGAGCAISKASASLMTSAVKGKSVKEALDLFGHFRKMISGKPGDAVDEARLGKLAVFSGVCEFPIRVKCATLAWHALKSGIDGSRDSVSTE